MTTENLHPGTKDHHEYSREKGYERAEYEHSEYPKVVGYEKDGVTAIHAQNAEDEARLCPKEEATAEEVKPEEKVG